MQTSQQEQAELRRILSESVSGRLAVNALYIFDLDYTLSDPSHRAHHLKKDSGPDWEAFFLDCAADAPVPACILTLQALHAAGAEILIWTGRSAVVAAQTKEWLYVHKVPYHELLMRPALDRRSDYELKGEWMDKLPAAQKAKLVAVFDDNTRMAEYWRARGIPCFQVRDNVY